MTAVAYRPVSQMRDAELIAEADALKRAEDVDALASPVALARHLGAGYRVRRHLLVIGAALRAIHTGECDRLMILTPPQVGKSVTASVWGSFWWLALHPYHRVIAASYANSLAINRGRSVRKLVLEHGWRYDMRLERGSQAANDWTLLTGGGMRSVGVGAGVTGFPGDLAVIDDPHKSRAEADSLRKRDAISDWYSGDIVSRMSPGAAVILIMTPWHPDDLRGRLLADEGAERDGGRWRVVKMPALCTDPDTDPLGRGYGEPLTHPKIPSRNVEALLRHWHDKRRGSRVRDWGALYQCDPQPAEGALVTRELLKSRRHYLPGTERMKVAVSVDPSGGGRDVAGVIGGYLATDRRLYFTHDRSAVMSSADWAREACVLAAETTADRIVIETNYGGDQATLVVRTAWDALVREAVANAMRAELDAGADPELAAAALVTAASSRRKLAGYLERGWCWRRHNVNDGVLGGAGAGEAVDGREGRWVRVPGVLFAALPPRIVAVRSKVGKLLRAEPIAQQWLEDRVRTAAYLPELEDEWATWQPDHTDSPGRIDASVHLAYSLLRAPGAARGATPAGVSKEQAASAVRPDSAVKAARRRTPPRPGTIPRGYPGG